MLSIYLCMWDYSLELAQPTMDHTLQEKQLTLLQKPSSVHSSSFRGRSSWAPPSSNLECWLFWSCAGNHSSCGYVTGAVLSCPEDTVSTLSSPPSGSYCFFSDPSSLMAPESCGRRVWSCDTDVPLVAEQPIDTYSLYLVSCKILCSAFHCTTTLNWWGLRSAETCLFVCLFFLTL